MQSEVRNTQVPIRRQPILIGGGGEKKTLRLVAQYVDVWDSATSSAEELEHKIDVLHRRMTTAASSPRICTIHSCSQMFHR